MGIIRTSKQNKVANYCTILILVMMTGGCNNDDISQTIEITVQDMNIEIDENPNNNMLLGSISASTTQGNLSFELRSESHIGAFTLDSQKGELFVKDSSLFDFELNPTLNATVNVINDRVDSPETTEIVITLLDIDEVPDGIPFVTTWEVSSDDLTVLIPINTDYVYNYFVDWGDGSNSQNLSNNASHTYSKDGIYSISILGEFAAIDFSNESDLNNSNNKKKIISIKQWGNNEWKSMHGAFSGCSELIYSATDTPDLSSVNDMSEMFTGAIKFNGAIGDWEVNSVTNMFAMFANAQSFNQNLGDWDVSQVSNMAFMFSGASLFNQPVNNWKVGQVTSMYGMFLQASVFNHPLDKWDVCNVNNMAIMFSNASGFDQSLGNWNLSNLISTTSSNGMISMLDQSGLSIDSYESTLKGWSESANTPCCVQLGANKMVYCSEGEVYRNILITKNWSFGLDRKGNEEECQ